MYLGKCYIVNLLVCITHLQKSFFAFKITAGLETDAYPLGLKGVNFYLLTRGQTHIARYLRCLSGGQLLIQTINKNILIQDMKI